MEGKVAVVNSQHHVSEGLGKGLLLQRVEKLMTFLKIYEFFTSKKPETPS